METGNYSLTDLAVALAVIIAAFVVCREILCWYWKQTEIVHLLKDLRSDLAKISQILKNRKSDGGPLEGNRESECNDTK